MVLIAAAESELRLWHSSSRIDRGGSIGRRVSQEDVWVRGFSDDDHDNKVCMLLEIFQ